MACYRMLTQISKQWSNKKEPGTMKYLALRFEVLVSAAATRRSIYWTWKYQIVYITSITTYI